MKINSIQAQSHPGQRRRGTQAFSLIECVVAVSVILIGFVTIFGSMTMGFSITQLSRENLRATQIMLDKMEGVRLYSWTQITNSSYLIPAFTNWFFETNNIGASTATGNGVLYTGLVSVGSVPFSTTYSTNMVKVTVSVGWTSVQGNLHHTRSVSTLVGSMGLQTYIYNN
jgi:Tfp pilus assembly protein PilV